MNKSIIISYTESDDYRKSNLKMVLDYLYWLMDGKSEIIIVEQDSESKLIKWVEEVKSFESIKHIFIKNEGVFNKGWGYNIGAKIAESKNLIFHDADMFLKLESYKHSLNILNQFDVVNPYKSVVFLSKETTSIFKQNNYNFSVTRLHKPILHSIITGGIFMMKKDKFMELKGFDEDCYGYGHEDDIFDTKIKKLDLKVQTVNDLSVHVYHDTNENSEYHSFLELNKLLFDQYVDMTKDQLLTKINRIDKWGDIKRNVNNEMTYRHIKRDMFKTAAESVLDNVLDMIDDKFIEDIITDLSGRIYNEIIESISEKLKNELGNIKYTPEQKKSMISKILSKIRL